MYVRSWTGTVTPFSGKLTREGLFCLSVCLGVGLVEILESQTSRPGDLCGWSEQDDHTIDQAGEQPDEEESGGDLAGDQHLLWTVHVVSPRDGSDLLFAALD